MFCYKCGKLGHKGFQSKTEQKINELFAYQPELQKKLIVVLAQNSSDFDTSIDYYQSSEYDDSEYESSSIKAINVITNRNQKVSF